VASDDELREEVRTTLLHETGHFFGMDDAELGQIGLG
jgi:predicted Zn-dependent protease with MMP-like domain